MNTSIAQDSGIPESVIRWMFQVIQPIYKHDPRATFHDCMVTLTQFKNLRPRTRVFTHPGGQSELLLCLHGTINDVPILVWVQNGYPASYPLIYIDLEKLSAGIRIIVSDVLQNDGSVYLSLFDQWDPMTCNIAQTLQLFEQIPREILLDMEQHGPPALPPKPTTRPPVPERPIQTTRPALAIPSQVSGTFAAPMVPERPTRAGTSNIPRRDEVLPPIAFDLMDTELSVKDSTHEQLLGSLQTIITQLSEQESNRINETRTLNNQRYSDVIKKFKDNLEYENNMVNYINENVQRYKNDLHAQTEVLSQFEKDKLSQHSPEIDNVLTTGNEPLYELVSLDLALTDTIEMCCQMLNKGILPVDHFVRETRLLGTKQFHVRDAILHTIPT